MDQTVMATYGEAQVDERHKTWDMLKYIRSTNDLPWLCVGDFNEVLHREEHVGVNERSWTQIAGFREAVDVCGLYDLGYRGVPWTFEKRVAGGSFFRVRLDRGLATPAWCARFPEAEVHHLAAYATSDHLPILVKLDPRSEQQKQRRHGLFRYEVMWEKHEKFSDFIGESWNATERSRNVSELKNKLQGMSGKLKAWNSEKFGSVKHQIRALQCELGELRTQPDRLEPSYEEVKLVEKLSEVLHCEEVMWRQRSRIQWLAEGDKNTRFFHLRASQRKKKNRIAELVKQDGTTTSDEDEMGRVAKEFYQQLYSSEGVSGMEHVLNCVPRKVSPEMNSKLDAPFSVKEVKDALFEMYPTKAPGPTGSLHIFSNIIGMCAVER
jgi:hypothetical protein